jgi:predicted DNA-binding transcriptional regulator
MLGVSYKQVIELQLQLREIQKKLIIIYNYLIETQKKMDESNETVSVNDVLSLSIMGGAKKKRGPKPQDP